MSNFKNGDIVEVTGLEDIGEVLYNNRIYNQLTGKALEVSKDTVTVEFNRYVGGSYKFGNGKKGYCWEIPKKNLIKISSMPINLEKDTDKREIEVLYNKLEASTKRLYIKSLQLALEKDTYKILNFMHQGKTVEDIENIEKGELDLTDRNEKIRNLISKDIEDREKELLELTNTNEEIRKLIFKLKSKNNL